MNANDLRSVRAFLSDGTELGELEVQGVWRMIPHNLRLRQQILSDAGQRRGRGGVPEENPIEAYVKRKLAEAKKNRKSASQLAHAQRLRASTETVRPPAGPMFCPQPPNVVGPETRAPIAATMEPHDASAPRPRARPRKLSIGTGQVF